MSIGDTIFYDIKWYELNEDIKKKLQFMIMRTHYPLYIDAFPLGSMNYALFVGVRN